MNTCSKHSYETEAQELKKFLFMEDVFYSHCLKYIYKKSGTALLLFRISRPWNCLSPEQATPKPTPICTLTHTPTYGVHGYVYTYPEDIKMLQCLG